MKTIHLLICLLLSVSLFGQKLYPIQEKYDSFTFKITLKNGVMNLEQQGSTGLFAYKKGFPEIQQVVMEDADLVLEYQPNNGGDLLSFKTQMQLKKPDGGIVIPQPVEFGDLTSPIGGRRMVWYDLLEYVDDFEGAYTLYVRRSLMGAVNCEAKRPKFTLKDVMPYNYIGFAGIMVLSVGQLFKEAKEEDYNTYKQLWAEGAPDPLLSGYGNTTLARAKKNDDKAKLCTWIGISLLVTNSQFLSLHQVKIKRKQNIYDQFCAPEQKNSLLLSPSKKGVGIVLTF